MAAMKRILLFPLLRLLLFAIFFQATVASARAQDAASPKFVPFAGAGILASQGHTKGEFQAGAAFEEAPPDAWGGFSFEAGVLGPWAIPKARSPFLSFNYMAAWQFGPSGKGRTPKGGYYWHDLGRKLFPFATAGYTRLFGTGNAVNFGGGFDYRFNYAHAIRTEVRDYYSFASPTQHNVALRIGLVLYIPD
jgi:hypothetical protein